MPEMTERDQWIAKEIYQAIQDHSNGTDRSRQAGEWKVGVSDLGHCSERVRRMLMQQDPEDTDVLAAFIGSAIGRDVEEAVAARWGDKVILQPEVVLTLKGEQRTYNLPGHPDIVTTDGLVLDGKTTRGLALVERNGASRQQRFQRHGYGLACFNAGLFDPSVKLEDVVVGNVWLDRAADDKHLHVETEALSLDVIREMEEWLDEVVYCFTSQQEAPKEPPREMCEKTCGFFSECRLYDTDVEGLITDPLLVDAAAMYDEGRALVREGERKKDQAKAALKEVSGATREFLIRHTWINESPVPGYVRKGYWKIDVRRRKVK